MYTSRLGDDIAEYTEESLKQYCAKHHAELRIIPQTSWPQRYWTLFDAMNDSLTCEEQTSVWMDFDIIIDYVRAPSLWDTLDNRLFFCRHDEVDHAPRAWRRKFNRLGCPNIWPFPVTSMVKWNYRHALQMMHELNRWRHKKLVLGLTDEEACAYFSYKGEIPWFYFPQGWHRMSAHYDDDAFFYHAAGREKIPKLDRAVEILKRKNEKVRD